MSDFPFFSPNEITENPIEAELSQAIAIYKYFLIKTSYRNFWHRLSCKIGDKEALENERQLELQMKHCRKLVNQSTAHQDMLLTIISRQPEDIRQRDQLILLKNP
ncbi:hypothetical protein JND74_003514 [Salmonella enterica]|nr:hypothetical protein [Salmonella enterica]EIR0277993.1 hypothetical protein [Salmonella enterica]